MVSKEYRMDRCNFRSQYVINKIINVVKTKLLLTPSKKVYVQNPAILKDKLINDIADGFLEKWACLN